MNLQKKYSVLSPELIHLLDQLIVNHALNENALKKIQDDIAIEKVERLSAKKKLYIKELANIMDVDMEEYKNEHRKNIDIKQQKVISQFDDLFLKENDIRLIAFLINAEKKLQNLYYTLIYHCRFDDFVLMILKIQLSDSKRDISELYKIQKEYI